ncbi:hypothetical protein E7V67_019210 [[Empedobacter] haloabium]|uniref:DUF3829 domain-containing protein n=1 Tax=[Empedobacter] haloabium TaxID=592317 RepID=A0ABZ1UGH4_9BURK
MKIRYAVTICSAAMLSGCATAPNFTKALEGPVAAANAAKLVVQQADLDIDKARAMGLVGDYNKSAADLVCKPLESTVGTLRSLSAFGEAVELVKDVAEKPEDDSYASYLQQFRKNKKSIADAAGRNDIDLAMEKSRKEDEAATKAMERCATLYASDVRPANRLDPAYGTPESFKSLGALSSLVKGILAAIESGQRAEAVRKTAVALIPGLKLAQQQLSAAPQPKQPHVAYSFDSVDTEARLMGETRLGATINLRRWFVARQIEHSLAKARQCKGETACLGDPLMRITLDNLASDIHTYRELATIDTVQILSDMKAGIDKAEQAGRSPGNWAQVLDALVNIYDALGGLSSRYHDWQASRQ